MKISELQELLEKAKEGCGDIEVMLYDYEEKEGFEITSTAYVENCIEIY